MNGPSRRALSTLALLVPSLLIVAAGCLDLSALREKDYSRVTLAQIDGAAGSEDPRVEAGLLGILEARLERPAGVDLDQVLLALHTLSERRCLAATPLLGRTVREDPREEVRWMALDALAALDGAGSRGVIEEAARADGSALVRERAREVLAASDEASPQFRRR